MPIEHFPDGWFVAGCPCCGKMGLLLQAPKKGSLPPRRPTIWDQGEPDPPSILISVGCANCKATVTMDVYEQ